MIGIINTGDVNESGEHRYRLQINQWVKGEFHHKREDGLAVCLEKAAECARHVEKQERESLAKIGDEILELIARGQL